MTVDVIRAGAVLNVGGHNPTRVLPNNCFVLFYFVPKWLVVTDYTEFYHYPENYSRHHLIEYVRRIHLCIRYIVNSSDTAIRKSPVMPLKTICFREMSREWKPVSFLDTVVPSVLSDQSNLLRPYQFYP